MGHILALLSENLGLATVVIVLLLLVLVDVIYAVVRLWTGRAAHDPSLGNYLESKFTILVVMVVAAIIDPLLPDVPVFKVVGVFYALLEVAIILSAAARDGAPIPWADKMRQLERFAGGQPEDRSP